MASISGTTMALMAVMAAASAASTTTTVMASNNQAEAAQDAAKNAAAADYVQQTEAQYQINAKAAQERQERAKQALIERAKLRVSQGESGISGVTADREFQETYMQEGYDASILETNRANDIRQVEAEKNKTYANQKGKINLANSKITSSGLAALQIGTSALGGAVSGYGMGRAIKGK